MAEIWTSASAPASRAASATVRAPSTWTDAHRPAEDAAQIDDGSGALDRLAHAHRIGDIRLREAELANLAERLDDVGRARIALGDADADAALHQIFADVAADEAASAEYGDKLFCALDHGAALASGNER